MNETELPRQKLYYTTTSVADGMVQKKGINGDDAYTFSPCTRCHLIVSG